MGDKNLNNKKIKILKPHGSLSFSLNKRGYLVSIFKDKNEMDLTFPNHHDDKSITDIFSDIDVIMPSYIKPFKNRTLRYMFHEAANAISQAEDIIFIGYSIPEADTMSQILFSYIGQDRHNKMVEKNLMTVNGSPHEGAIEHAKLIQ